MMVSPFKVYLRKIQEAVSSTLSDYMITLFKIVIPAWIAGIQAPWMDLSLPSMALDTRFPAGMTSFRII